MVARINCVKNISKAIHYNEQKVQVGKATLLAASGFIKEAGDMNLYEKLERFQSMIALNERTKTNTVHVSLNFDPSENIEPEKMRAIAGAYMEKIGFTNQPYLVYRHYDSGHPHLHIVSTNIQRYGKRIDLHNIGRNQSEKARKEIELAFNLVKADSRKLAAPVRLIPGSAQKVIYGKAATKQAISNVLLQVIDTYKYSSLAELNALLQRYNVVADPGGKGSDRFQQKGLVNYGMFYCALDENGRKIGVPVKASAFFMKPTRAYLEKKFTANETLKAPFKKRITTAIDWALLSKPTDIKELISLLEKENIHLVLQQNKAGATGDCIFIDHTTSTIFNGDDLSKAYSANALREKCRPALTLQRVTETTCKQSAKQLPPQYNQHNTVPQSENNAQAFPEKRPPLQVATIVGQKEQAAGNPAPLEAPEKKKKKRKTMGL